MILAVSLEVTIWAVPSLIGNAVAVSIVGMLLGPMYPILMNQSAKLLPPWLLTGSIGWIAGLGQAGSALLPFMTGALAARFGIQSLQPLYVLIISHVNLLWFEFQPGCGDVADGNYLGRNPQEPASWRLKEWCIISSVYGTVQCKCFFICVSFPRDIIK